MSEVKLANHYFMICLQALLSLQARSRVVMVLAFFLATFSGTFAQQHRLIFDVSYGRPEFRDPARDSALIRTLRVEESRTLGPIGLRLEGNVHRHFGIGLQFYYSRSDLAYSRGYTLSRPNVPDSSFRVDYDLVYQIFRGSLVFLYQFPLDSLAGFGANLSIGTGVTFQTGFADVRWEKPFDWFPFVEKPWFMRRIQRVAFRGADLTLRLYPFENIGVMMNAGIGAGPFISGGLSFRL